MQVENACALAGTQEWCASRSETTLPNTLAYVALFAWPLVCVLLFVRLPTASAAIWSLLGGYLLVPAVVSLDVRYLPPLDKTSVTALTTYLLCLVKGPPSAEPRRSPVLYALVFCMVLSPVLTSLNNSYELGIGDRSLPGFYPLDSLKLALQNLVTLAPFFIGRRYLSSDHARWLLLKALPIAALAYSVPMLFEIRFSPQLQRLVFGANPAGFITLVRAGGYRPLVFLGNGLELAMFMSMSLVAALVAIRAKGKIVWSPPSVVAAYFAGLLLLCKTLGAFIYGAAAAPLIFLSKPKTWVRVSCFVVLIILSYPLLRTYDIIPVRRVATAAAVVSAERAGSLQFRIENENQLLAKANEKPLTGWGTWGRNRIYNAETGADESITDGAWILRFGMFGWFGYLALFGIFTFAIFGALKQVAGPVTISALVLGGLTLMLMINLVDAIPNSNVVPLTFLIAGSIAGRVRPKTRVTSIPQPARMKDWVQLEPTN